MARRAIYDLARASLYAQAQQQRIQAAKEYGLIRTIEVHVGESVQWHHPAGFTVPATIVGIDKRKRYALIQVVRNGKQTEIEVGKDSLSVMR